MSGLKDSASQTASDQRLLARSKPGTIQRAPSGVRTVTAGLLVNGVLAILVFGAIYLSQQRIGQLESEEHLLAAEEALNNGNVDRAILHYEYVTRYTPERIEPRVDLIALFRRTGQDDKALEHVEAGLIHAKNEEQKTRLLLHLGGIRHDDANWQASYSAYARAIEVEPTCAEAYWGLAWVAKQQEDYPAMRDAIDSLGGATKDISTAEFRSRQRRYKERIAELTALDEVERTGQDSYRLGIAYLRSGDWENGVAAMTQAVQADDNETPGDAWFWLGAIAEAGLDVHAAIGYYHECLKRAPEHLRANKRLNVLNRPVNQSEARCGMIQQDR